MQAVIHDTYGAPEVLHLEEVERPVPKDDEVLIRIHAATVNRSDSGWRSAQPFFTRHWTGWRGPKRRILGGELAGEVVAVGAAVTEFAIGDRVFGDNGFGANAEFVSMRASRPLAHMPAGASFEEAAAVPDGFVLASGCLKPARLEEGRRILIYGASGSIGTAAVQVARYLGADVTAVCNTKNLELVKSLGADRVLDYTQEDFTKNGETYDVIFDAVGKHSFRRCRRSLRPGAMYITTDGGFLWHVPLLILLTRWFGSRRVLLPIPTYTKKDVLLVKELMEAGQYRAVIDRTYPLEQVVEATRYVETGQKTGNVVLTVGGDRGA
jgi:NADPH:quinone reductase-like Zn-dependent oxidoreductase